MNKQNILPDQSQRDQIQNELDINLLVEAAAGTGKTTSLIARMIALLSLGKCTINQMAAVTFTRKAASEMRSRFQIELEKVNRNSSGIVRQRIGAALENFERCFIGTIHSFCGRLLRERPVEAGVDIAFREIDEQEDQWIRSQVWDNYVSGLYAYDQPILSELQEAGLEISQLQQTFLKIADYPDVEEWPTDKVTFPEIDEVRNALLKYVVHMESLVPTLPQDPGNDELIPKYQRIPRLLRYHDIQQITQLMDIFLEFKNCTIVKRNWPNKKEQAEQEKERWDQFRADYSEPLLRKWKAFRYEIGLRAILPALEMYEKKKQQLGVLNFQDLLVKSAALLKHYPDVRSYFRQQITHLFIDEFQDTDPIQAEVMMLLTSEDETELDWRQCRPRPGSLFVLGDPKQSIYRFRRADIVTYNQVKEIIQQHCGKVLHLTSNFRTDPAILEWVNQTFQDSFPEADTPYSPQYVALQHGTPYPEIPEKDKILRIQIPSDFKTNEECLQYESERIAGWIHDEVQAGHAIPGDFMIVTYRTCNLSLYASQLEKYRIPCQVTGGDSLNQLDEIHLLTQCLIAVIQPHNPIALVGVLRNVLFGFSDPLLYEFKKNGGHFCYFSPIPESLSPETCAQYQDTFERLRIYHSWIQSLPPAVAIEKIADHVGLFAYASAHPGASERCGGLAMVISLIHARHEELTTFTDILDFLNQIIGNELILEGSSITPPESSTVRVMNLHKVKGLEAPIIILADPTGQYDHPASIHIDRTHKRTAGSIQMTHQSDGSWHTTEIAQPMQWDDLVEEEQRYLDAERIRLYYVAATRCKKQLIISRREKKNHQNPWQFFEQQLENLKTLEFPPLQSITASPLHELHSSDIEAALDTLKERLTEITEPTYAQSSVKGLLPDSEERHLVRENGVEWGELIHALLDISIRNPQIDLESITAAMIQDRNLNPDWQEKVIRQVQQVLSSDIGIRVRNSSRCFTELPFQNVVDSLDSEGLPTILRGQIDLVFQEEDGWVLVDYKTDIAAKKDSLPLIDTYQKQIEIYATTWQQLTGQPIKEAGFYFTETNQYIQIRFL